MLVSFCYVGSRAHLPAAEQGRDRCFRCCFSNFHHSSAIGYADDLDGSYVFVLVVRETNVGLNDTSSRAINSDSGITRNRRELIMVDNFFNWSSFLTESLNN